MIDLITKLEAATEGSSGLDWEIYLTATEHGRWEASQPAEQLILPWPEWIKNHPVEMRLPNRYDQGLRPYTRSFDSALTLLPEGKWWLVGPGRTRADEPLYGAAIYEPVIGEPNLIAEGEHEASAALALCIACLRARQALG